MLKHARTAALLSFPRSRVASRPHQWLGISRSAPKRCTWIARFRARGRAGLDDRSSRPHHIARRHLQSGNELSGAVFALLHTPPMDSGFSFGTPCTPAPGSSACLPSGDRSRETAGVRAKPRRRTSERRPSWSSPGRRRRPHRRCMRRRYRHERLGRARRQRGLLHRLRLGAAAQDEGLRRLDRPRRTAKRTNNG